jgi:hypothetical protein
MVFSSIYAKCWQDMIQNETATKIRCTEIIIIYLRSASFLYAGCDTITANQCSHFSRDISHFVPIILFFYKLSCSGKYWRANGNRTQVPLPEVLTQINFCIIIWIPKSLLTITGQEMLTTSCISHVLRSAFFLCNIFKWEAKNTVKIVSSNLVQCTPVDIYRHLGTTWCLHFSGRRVYPQDGGNTSFKTPPIP